MQLRNSATSPNTDNTFTLILLTVFVTLCILVAIIQLLIMYTDSLDKEQDRKVFIYTQGSLQSASNPVESIYVRIQFTPQYHGMLRHDRVPQPPPLNLDSTDTTTETETATESKKEV